MSNVRHRNTTRMLTSFFKQKLYVQLSPQLLSVRDPKSGQFVSEVPEIAIQRLPGKHATILAVGSNARSSASASPHSEVLNPFSHPRSLLSDFTLAEQLLKAFVKRIVGTGLFSLRLDVVIHPLGEHLGGLTQIEVRALRELALGAGAGNVHVWQGLPLADQQLLSEQFPNTGNVL